MNVSLSARVNWCPAQTVCHGYVVSTASCAAEVLLLIFIFKTGYFKISDHGFPPARQNNARVVHHTGRSRYLSVHFAELTFGCEVK
jgi:hypothetical protein